LPTLVENFEALNTNDQVTVFRQISRRYCEKQKETDIRNWNLSRQRATYALNAYASTLNNQCAPQVPPESTGSDF